MESKRKRLQLARETVKIVGANSLNPAQGGLVNPPQSKNNSCQGHTCFTCSCSCAGNSVAICCA